MRMKINYKLLGELQKLSEKEIVEILNKALIEQKDELDSENAD